MKPPTMKQTILDTITMAGGISLHDLTVAVNSTSPQAVKVMISQLRKEGHQIRSPRYDDRYHARKGLVELYTYGDAS